MTVLTAHLRMRSDDGDELFVGCFFFSAFILCAWFDELARIGIKPWDGWLGGHAVFLGGVSFYVLIVNCPTSYTPFSIIHNQTCCIIYLFPSRFHFITCLITRKKER